MPPLRSLEPSFWRLVCASLLILPCSGDPVSDNYPLLRKTMIISVAENGASFGYAIPAAGKIGPNIQAGRAGRPGKSDISERVEAVA
jgi:hypothetical protein